MMKINLLPRTINERKVVRNTAILFGVLVIAVVAIGIGYTQQFLVPQVQAEETLATQTEALQKEVEGIEADAKSWQDKIGPVKAKLDFISNVLAYNLRYPQLYENIAKWTYEKISYTGLTCDGAQVAMTAQAKNLDDLGRFLLNMYRATDLFTEVAISGVPGYPVANSQSGGATAPPDLSGMLGGSGSGANMAGMGAISTGVQNGAAARYIGFAVTCKLKTPIAAPTFTGGAPAADQSGAPGAAPPAMPVAGPPPGGG